METRELARASKRYHAAERALEQARAAYHAAVAAELARGVPQAQLVTATGYTREHLRRIARDAGLPAASSSTRAAAGAAAVFGNQP